MIKFNIQTETIYTVSASSFSDRTHGVDIPSDNIFQIDEILNLPEPNRIDIIDIQSCLIDVFANGYRDMLTFGIDGEYIRYYSELFDFFGFPTQTAIIAYNNIELMEISISILMKRSKLFNDATFRKLFYQDQETKFIIKLDKCMIINDITAAVGYLKILLLGPQIVMDLPEIKKIDPLLIDLITFFVFPAIQCDKITCVRDLLEFDNMFDINQLILSTSEEWNDLSYLSELNSDPDNSDEKLSLAYLPESIKSLTICREYIDFDTIIDLSHLSQLENLDIFSDETSDKLRSIILPVSIQKLWLDLDMSRAIINSTELINLKSIIADGHNSISGLCISDLINLESITMYECKKLTKQIILPLLMKDICIMGGSYNISHDLTHLTNLTEVIIDDVKDMNPFVTFPVSMMKIQLSNMLCPSISNLVDLTRLTCINLSDTKNRLSISLPSEIRKIDISYSKISINNLSDLVRLEKINMSYNFTIPNETILPVSIKWIDISYSSCNIISDIYSLVNLERIVLNNTNPGTIMLPESIKWVGLGASNCNISNLPDLINLEHISMNRNTGMMGDITMPESIKIISIKESLCRSIVNISKLSRLTKLTLCFSKTFSRSITLPLSIEYLHMFSSSCGVVTNLRELVNLKYIDIRGNMSAPNKITLPSLVTTALIGKSSCREITNWSSFNKSVIRDY